ncbi:hypothetical protein [Ralstonia mannitolilytica]|uniref:hypothetical protein n=1 Tax=Ralstonia mannitolilytica TaxID=105219 RepID=UPI0028F56B50|nr:hypothetical protein [Ralstonia mannitolilytica]CAJ0743876.1 hypothetical protein R76696_04690 [Ralstonia mannitolilytica]
MQISSGLDGYLIDCASEPLEAPYFRVSWTAIPDGSFPPGPARGETYICHAHTEEEALATVRQRAQTMIRLIHAHDVEVGGSKPDDGAAPDV